MNIALPIVAGAISTAVFAISALPMLVKAARTRDMSSYSLSNIALCNVGTSSTPSTSSTCRPGRCGCCTSSIWSVRA
jgi:hypothetical protein